MKDQSSEIIELKVDGQEVRLNAYVRSVLREVNLGIIRTLELPAPTPQTLELTLKLPLFD